MGPDSSGAGSDDGRELVSPGHVDKGTVTSLVCDSHRDGVTHLPCTGRLVILQGRQPQGSIC